jgi:hypothetical protein
MFVTKASDARGRAGGVCMADNFHFDVCRLGRTVQKRKVPSAEDESKGLEVFRG